MNRQEDRMYHDEQFMPETVDEQIDQCSRLPGTEAINGQLINDLHSAYKEYTERRDRVWARVEAQVKDRFSTEQMGIIPGSLPTRNATGEKRNPLQRYFSFSQLHSRRASLELIAAMLVAILIVGSMLWLATITHPFQGGTIVASRPTSSQGSSKQQIIKGQGIIYPNQEQDIQYPEAVKVTAVKVSAGQMVKAGQLLLNLDSSKIISQIQLAQAKVAAAQALLNQDRVHDPKQIAPDQQQLVLAEQELQQLQALANATPDSHVTASISGLVTQVNARAGQIVSANTVLLTIMDESTVVMHAKVPQNFIGKIRVGQTATVTTSSLPDRSFNGAVTSIVPQIDPKTHTLEVWVSIPNTTNVLVAGMSAQVQF